MLELSQIIRQERALKRLIASAVRLMLPARRVAQESVSRTRLRVAALQSRLREILLDAAASSYRDGRQAAERLITSISDFSGDGAPAIPTEWLRWYEQTTDAALHRYGTRVRREIEELTVQAAGDGWTIPRLTEEIERVTSGLATFQAERIARTETMRLWNLGSFGRMEEEPPDVLIGYEYSVVLDDRCSHVCKPLDGLRVRREELRYVPPLHPHCRTILNPVFAHEAVETRWGDPFRPQPVPGFGAIPSFRTQT